MVRPQKTKRTRSFFFRDKIIVTHKKKIKELEKHKKDLIQRLKDVVNSYNNKPFDDYLERLPIETTQDFYSYLAGQGIPSGMAILEARQVLRKEHEYLWEELEQIERDLNTSNLDLILSQIDCMERKIDGPV